MLKSKMTIDEGLNSAISIALLTGHDSFDPSGIGDMNQVSCVKLSNNTGAVLHIKGILAPTNKRKVGFWNNGPDVVRFRPENASGATNERITSSGNTNLNTNQYVEFEYDFATLRWHKV